MKEKLDAYTRKNKRRKRWQQVVTAMAAVVVFCTTYALILPAITLENTPTCGIEEHQHEDACYRMPQTALLCTNQVHSHGPECLDEQGHVICGNETYLVHTHDELCYNQAGELVCTLPEAEIHVHTESCYEIPSTEPVQTEPVQPPETEQPHVHDESCYAEIPGELICTEEEKKGHIHSDETACYTYEETLVCTAEETEGHQHSEGCFDTEGNLICTIPELPAHIHDDACYQMTAVLVCTMEESLGHVHGEDCYGQPQQVLTCEKSEAADADQPPAETQAPSQEQTQEPVLVCGYGEYVVHQHTQDCYGAEGEPVLICEKEEHIHDDLRCYADLNADLETEADWVKTFPELSGYWREDILAIADSQVGYHESTRNYIVEEDGSVKGYTRYGEWYGYPHGDWCAMFTSFCLHYAGIPEEMVPIESSCRRWIELLEAEELDLFRPAAEESGEAYAPVPGDLVFFDLNGDGISDHVGVVEYLEEGTLHTIEGNRKNAVQRLEYELTDPVLVGYCMIPEQPAELLPEEPTVPTEETIPEEELLPTEEMLPTEEPLPTEETLPEEETLPMDETLPTEDQLPGEETLPVEETEPTQPPVVWTERTIRAVIYTDATLQQRAEDETAILITGLLPEGAAARAYPVVLEDDLIAGETVLLAYDITIVDAEGNPINQGEDQATFTVSIQPPGWTPSEDENYNIYYVPEDGAPEIMDSESAEDTVSFTTDHFSTYALTATGSANTIYLNGASGDDSNAGTSTGTAVKTLDKALALVKEGGTIYISGTVTVSDSQDWEMENDVTIKRYSGFTGPLVTVANGGSLTLKDITINGGSAAPSSSNIASNTTYASGSAKAPLIVVQSGGRLNIQSGAVLEYNSNKPDISSNKFVKNGYVGLGGAVYCQGNLTMTGGTIRYCEAQSGGGIYIESAGTNRITFRLDGGTITNNYARDIVPQRNRSSQFHTNAGGGIYVGDYVTMNMTGGTVSANQSSREGGGISLGWLDRSKGAAISSYITTFNMTGGTITGNTATSTGGGLNITAGREAYLSAGTFTNNTANGKEYQTGDGSTSWDVYSGGGIYLDAQQYNSSGNYAGVPGYALVHRVLITDNEAGYYGGGIATCSTSDTYISSSVETDGTLIYGNTADSGNEMHLSGTVNLVGDTAMGGIKYNWSKSGSAYDNSLSDNTSGVAAAKAMATVIITGNRAGMDGGGIGCNGQLEIGGSPSYESISITKVWNDDGTVQHPDSITVQVYQDGKAYGEPVTIRAQVDSTGKETWPTVYVGELPTGHTYTVEEVKVPGFDAEVTSSGNSFTITNTPAGFTVIKKWVGDTESDRPGSITVQLYQDGKAYGDAVELTDAKGWKHIWVGLPEGHTYTAREIEIPQGYYSIDDGGLNDDGRWEIVNTKIPDTSVSVEKKWSDGIIGADSVTVQLLAGGVKVDEAVLSADNDWYHKWDNLPKLNERGGEIRYTVEENALKGYSSSVSTGTAPSETKKSWKEVSGLESGKTYLLVSSNGALAVSGSSLTWAGVNEILESGEDAQSNTLWTWSNNKLKNGNKYLYLSSNSATVSNSGSTITWSNGKISASSSRYTYYLSSNNGSVSVSTRSSSAVTFTAYEQVTTTVSGGDVHYVITNTKLPDAITFHFAKYAVGASDQPTLLSGAELELYKVSDAGDVTIPGTDQKGTLVRRWTSESASGANGGIHTEDLYSGTYYLIETRTPSGHTGLSGPVIFRVTAEDTAVELIACPYELTLESGSEVDFPIYNAVAYLLPETGGMGTGLYTAGGLLLTTAAVVLLILSCIKRRKGANVYF